MQKAQARPLDKTDLVGSMSGAIQAIEQGASLGGIRKTPLFVALFLAGRSILTVST